MPLGANPSAANPVSSAVTTAHGSAGGSEIGGCGVGFSQP